MGNKQIKAEDLNELLFWEKLIKTELNKHTRDGRIDSPSSVIMRRAFSDLREQRKLSRKK